MANIGEKLRLIRKQAGLSQVDFAQSLEITQGFLSGIEKGKYQPTTDLLIRITNIYKADAGWLLTGKEGEEPTVVAESAPVYLPQISPAEKRKLKLVNILVRIVDEGNEKKIKAVESQLDLLDPGEKKPGLANEPHGGAGSNSNCA